MSFEPRAKDIVKSIDPENKNAEPVITFVVRRATREDKESFVNRMKLELGSGETIDEDSLKAMMENNRVFLCIENDEITLIDQENIPELVFREGVEIEQPQPSGGIDAAVL